MLMVIIEDEKQRFQTHVSEEYADELIKQLIRYAQEQRISREKKELEQ